MSGIADLIAWREAADLAARIQDGVAQLRGPGAAAMADQMVRAADSIAANIAEGYGRGVTRDCVRFLKMAKSSADELESHLRVASLRRRMPGELALTLVDQARRVGYLIFRFQKSVDERRRKRDA